MASHPLGGLGARPAARRRRAHALTEPEAWPARLLPLVRHATTPASYLSPSTIDFLALGARSRYRFGVTSQSGDREAAERGSRWLQGRCIELGVGARAAGCGCWELHQTSGGPPPRTPRFDGLVPRTDSERDLCCP